MIVKDLVILNRKSEPVMSVVEANDIIKQLEEELAKCNGYGLSAIQIGIPKQVAIIKSSKGNGFINIINPEVKEKEDEFIFNGEGCLSFPDIFGKTKRFEQFVIVNKVIDGDIFRDEVQYYPCIDHGDKESLVDYESLAAQHEIDHFDGLTIMDYAIEKYTVQKNLASNGLVLGNTVKKIDVKIGRNDPCHCGSGKKFKKCCLPLEVSKNY